MDKIYFQYCNRFILHTIWYSLVLLFFIIFIFLYKVILFFVGISENGISDFWFKYEALFWITVAIIPCIALILIFIFSMLLAIKIQNKTGTVIFYNNYCIFHLKDEIKIFYRDIKNITFMGLPQGRASFNLYKIPFRLTIIYNNKEYKIDTSLKESWFNKDKDFSLQKVYEKIISEKSPKNFI